MAKTERSGHTTIDHDFIRRWVEERGGWPARVVGTGGDDDPGLIRIDFPGFSGEGSLERIEWDAWFEGFEGNQLAFLHRDMDHGGGDLDRFNKLISRTGDEDGEGGDEDAGGGRSSSSRGASARKSSSGGTGSKAGGGKASSGRGGKSAADTGAKGGGKASPGRGGKSAADTGAKGGGKASSGRGGKSATADTGASGGGTRRTGKAASGGAAEGAGGGELRGLLLHDLGDLLSAERLFLGTTRTLAREAQDPEVKARAEEHVAETEGQIERLKEAFGALGERPRAVTCEAARGLKEEHDSYKSEEKPSRLLLSAFGLGAGLRVEHYEIAAYRSAIELANALGEKQCAQILNESLKEEMAMASFLEKNSRAVLKRMAAGEAGSAASTSPARGGSSSAKSSRAGGGSPAKKSTRRASASA